MQDMGIEPGDIKSIEDIGKLPFTTKEDLRENYPFGLLAIPQKGCCPCAGNIRYNRKTDDCSLFAERCRSIGGNVWQEN